MGSVVVGRRSGKRLRGVQAEGAAELRTHGHLSNGATPLWIQNARSGMLPLLPAHVLHIDHVAETVLLSASVPWLQDHLAPRMARSPRLSACLFHRDICMVAA